MNRVIVFTVAAPQIQRIEEMRGKSIGVTRVGTVTDFFTRIYLRQNGLVPDRDVMIRQMGGLPEIVAGLKAGQIDGGTFGFPAVLHARAAGFRVLVDYNTAGYRYPLSTVIVTQKLLRTQFPIQPAPASALANIAKLLSDTKAMLVRHEPRPQQAVAARPVEIIPPNIIKGLTAIANSAWRAKTKMVDPTTGEPHEAMTRVYKDIDRIYRHLEDIGFRIRNHTGDPYDDGQPMKVVTSEPRSEATRKYVLTTLLPTIYWNDHIIQHGEIEIAVPPSANNS